MKTHKKLVSILCAVALLVSALPAAAAVSAEPLSKYAGKTVPVQVVEDTKDGLTSHFIEVAIPKGATRTEENFIVYQAAFGKGETSTFSANAERFYDISYEENITLEDTAKWVGGGKPQGIKFNLIDEIYISFDVKDLDRESTSLYFQVRAASNPSVTSEWKNIKPTQVPYTEWKVVFKFDEYPLPGDDELDVYAKTSISGIATLNYCMVAGIKK